MKTDIDRQQLMKKTGIFFMTVFYLACFLSKPAMNIAGLLSLLIAFAYIVSYNKEIFKKNKFLTFLLLPYGIGFLLSFCSNTGFDAAIHFLNRFKFFVMFIPLAAFIDKRGELNHIILGLIVSAVFASVYGLYKYSVDGYAGLDDAFKIGRFADMLVVVLSINLTLFFQQFSKKKIYNTVFHIINVLIMCLFIWILILTGMRAAWVGCIAMAIICSIFFYRKLIVIVLLMALIVLCLPNTNSFKKHMMTIKIGQDSNLKEEEVNDSNLDRIDLWKTGIDFAMKHLIFGVGERTPKKQFKDFFLSQPKAYQERYKYALMYPGNFHNSYLQILIVNGLIYFIIYFGSLFYIILRIGMFVRHVKDNEKHYIIITILSSAAFLTAQFFHGELFSYGVAAYYLTLFCGCFIANKNGIDWSICSFLKNDHIKQEKCIAMPKTLNHLHEENTN